MSSLFLTLHISGALVTVATVMLAIWRLIRCSRIQIYIIALPAIAAWQIVSGVGLLLTVPGISLGRFCISGLAYLAIVGTVQYLLVKRLRSSLAVS